VRPCLSRGDPVEDSNQIERAGFAEAPFKPGLMRCMGDLCLP
jgi:hypothetical protein